MTSVKLAKDPAALAKELNQFVTNAGGQPIAGLDKLDPKQLLQIRDGLKQFLDNFDQAKAQDPELAKLADSAALKSLRQLAQIASTQVDDSAARNHTSTGMCGGGGAPVQSAPPPPPPPPPVSAPETPKAPPVAAPPPPANTAPPPSNGDNAAQPPAAPVKTGPLSNGAGSPIQLSQDDVQQGLQQINALKGQIDAQRAVVVQQRQQLQSDITALANKPNRTPAEDALLTAKRQQMQVLNDTDRNLDLKKQGLDAAAFAIRDGVVTPSELTDLQTISRAVQGRDVQLQQFGAQLNQTVQQLQSLAGPLAGNGSNFDPTAMNAVAAAALLAGAMGAAQAGVLSPTGPLASLFGNAANAVPANATAQSVAANNNAVPATGGLDQPSSIGDDNTAGTDASLAALKAAGGGGGFFEDRVFAVMCKVVEDFQKQIEQRLDKLQQEAQDAQSGGGGGGGGKGGGLGGMIGGIAGSFVGGPVGGMIGKAAGGAIGGAVDGGGGSSGGSSGGANGEESRNIEFEKIKYDMQKLSQMQQAMSNILNSMDELAKDTIRHIKGS